MLRQKASISTRPSVFVSARPRKLIDNSVIWDNWDNWDKLDNVQIERNSYTCLEEFEMQFAFKLKQYDKLLEEKLAGLDRAKERLKIKYSAVLTSTLEASNAMELLHEKENASTSGVQRSSQRKGSKTKTAASSFQGPHGKKSSRRSKKNKEQALVPHSGARFQLPAISTELPMLRSIVPKVPMDTPISMLRLPRQGELALSLSGSPVMVSAMSHESKPNINIPLKGNQVLTLIPHERMDPNSIPDLDDEAMRQLQALNKNLQAFIKMTK